MQETWNNNPLLAQFSIKKWYFLNRSRRSPSIFLFVEMKKGSYKRRAYHWRPLHLIDLPCLRCTSPSVAQKNKIREDCGTSSSCPPESTWKEEANTCWRARWRSCSNCDSFNRLFSSCCTYACSISKYGISHLKTSEK